MDVESSFIKRTIGGAALLCAVLVCAGAVHAQEYRATLTGQVKDSQSGLLPGVAVTATHADTGTKFEAVTDGTGSYTFAFLAPGTYTVTAELTGFRRFIREGVPLSSGGRATLDITLEVGNLAESIVVSGTAPLLSTGTASVGVVVEADQIDNLPMSGRAPSSLVHRTSAP
jgi:hypothetical protein